MRKVSANIWFPLPDWLYARLKKVNQRLESKKRHVGPNLSGDRDIEWSWIAANIPQGTGVALDFGPGGSFLGLIAAQRGFNVEALDLEPLDWPYIHQRLKAYQGDILTTPFSQKRFDLVLNCSTVEHVGLPGRYGVTKDQSDGDLDAMRILRSLMKPNATMLLTIPIGRDGVFPPLARVYGETRLPRLIQGFKVKSQTFWTKDQHNRWVETGKDAALRADAFAGSWNPLENYYGLGCFILTHKKN